MPTTMNQLQYDITKEPWITVLRNSDKTIVSVGVEEVLRNGHNYKCIIDNNPLTEFGTYRLLTIILQDALELKTQADLLASLNTCRSGGWAAKFSIIEAYLNKYRDRFDLFSPDYPFLQDPTLDKKKLTYVATLSPETPSGINVTHLHRGEEKYFSISAEIATRLLTIQQPFVTMGGGGMVQSINGTPPWYVTVKGKNLLETLLLNCFCGSYRDSTSFGTPAWRREDKEVPSETVLSTDFMTGMTWQPRRILFIPVKAENTSRTCSITGKESKFYVEQMVFRPGAKLSGEWRDDPNIVYVAKAEGYKTLKPNLNRHNLVDIPNFVLSGGVNSAKEVIHRPFVVEQLLDIDKADKSLLPDTINFTVYGFYTDKAKSLDWTKIPLTIPKILVVNHEFSLVTREINTKILSVGAKLKLAIARASTYSGKADLDNALAQDGYRSFMSYIDRSYMNILPVVASVMSIGTEKTLANLHESWNTKLVGIARDIFLNTCKDLLEDPRLIPGYTRALNDLTK